MDRDRDEDRRDALSKEYGEVCQNFRTLTDIRFRLLTLLPIATAAAAAFKGDGTVGGSFVLPLFGLLATIGLVTYNTRNDQLYDYLVGRAACIERSLGLADGAFANRPAVWLSFRLLDIDHEKLLALVAQRVSDGRVLRRIEAMLTAKWEVDHRTAVSTIYWASIVVWLFLLLASLSAPLVSNSGSVWASLASLAMGADGLIIEVHPCPERALSDGPQSLDLDAFATLMEKLRQPRAREVAAALA